MGVGGGAVRQGQTRREGETAVDLIKENGKIEGRERG